MSRKTDNSKAKKPKKKKPNIFRITIAAALFFLQAGLLLSAIILMDYFALIVYVILDILAAIFTISIVYTERNASFKLLWVVVVLVIPGLGIILYLL